MWSSYPIFSFSFRKVQDLKQVLQREQNLRKVAEKQAEELRQELQAALSKAHTQRHAISTALKSQYQSMGAQCFSALALAMKLQLGDAVLPVSTTMLYSEAARLKVE